MVISSQLNKKQTPPRALYRIHLESFITEPTVFLWWTWYVVIGNFYHRHRFYLEISILTIHLANILGLEIHQQYVFKNEQCLQTDKIFEKYQERSFILVRNTSEAQWTNPNHHSKHSYQTNINWFNLCIVSCMCNLSCVI